jgi:hypothetical protein
VRRREFITLVGGAAAGWPLAARAQQTKVARIGFLGSVSASSHASRLAAFRAGLRDLGWLTVAGNPPAVHAQLITSSISVAL